MPNMDGMGPCCGNHSGHHHGMDKNSGGCRCGMWSCHHSPADEKTALIARKEALQRDLEAIEKRLETL